SVPCVPIRTAFPYTTLFRSPLGRVERRGHVGSQRDEMGPGAGGEPVVVEMGVVDGVEHPGGGEVQVPAGRVEARPAVVEVGGGRSEEHTSELQSREKLVCRI